MSYSLFEAKRTKYRDRLRNHKINYLAQHHTCIPRKRENSGWCSSVRQQIARDNCTREFHFRSPIPIGDLLACRYTRPRACSLAVLSPRNNVIGCSFSLLSRSFILAAACDDVKGYKRERERGRDRERRRKGPRVVRAYSPLEYDVTGR